MLGLPRTSGALSSLSLERSLESAFEVPEELELSLDLQCLRNCGDFSVFSWLTSVITMLRVYCMFSIASLISSIMTIIHMIVVKEDFLEHVLKLRKRPMNGGSKGLILTHGKWVDWWSKWYEFK